MSPNPNRPVVLVGAGGHGRVIAEILEALQCPVAGFFDEDHSIQEVWSYPVRHQVEAFGSLAESDWIISIGNNRTRKLLAERYALNYARAIHPHVALSPRTVIGEGTVVMAGVCINTGVIVGKHCILNTHCSVDHDCVLEDYVHISPGASLAGDVQVGEGTHVGIGASAIPGVRIGKWCTIGAGAVVIRDVPDGAKVMGVPGRVR